MAVKYVSKSRDCLLGFWLVVLRYPQCTWNQFHKFIPDSDQHLTKAQLQGKQMVVTQTLLHEYCLEPYG